jgi:polyhydroxybutyrate depolymerase
MFKERHYILYVPQSLKNDKQIPLVIVLHGALSNASYMEASLGLNAVAAKKSFAVAYLNGTGGKTSVMLDKRTWNAGGCCGPAEKARMDDISYISDFIEEMIENQNVDPAKIYLVGHSNGGMMAYRFACEKSGVLAAVVSVSGALTLNQCNGVGGLPVLEIHGDGDKNIPLEGGVGAESITRIRYRPTEQTGKELTKGGAKFEAKIIKGAGHGIADLNHGVLKANSMSLAEMIGRFIDGKSL